MHSFKNILSVSTEWFGERSGGSRETSTEVVVVVLQMLVRIVYER